MKLAEALLTRADLQKKIAQLKTRMIQNVKVMDGEEPAESVAELLAEFCEANFALATLIIRIVKTNAHTPFDEGTIIDTIVWRDFIGTKIKVYRELYEAAISKSERFHLQEIKYIRCVDTAKLQKDINELSQIYRAIDTSLQKVNWNTDLFIN